MPGRKVAPTGRLQDEKKVTQQSVRCFNGGQNVLTGWADHKKGAEEGGDRGGRGGEGRSPRAPREQRATQSRLMEYSSAGFLERREAKTRRTAGTENKPPSWEAPHPLHDYLHAAVVNTRIISHYNCFIDYPSILRKKKKKLLSGSLNNSECHWLIHRLMPHD